MLYAHKQAILLLCAFIPSTYNLPILVSSDYKIWGDWALLFEMVQAVLDSGFMTRWQLQWWSCNSPHLDRRKHLTSPHALSGWAAAVQCGTICKAQEESNYLNCVCDSRSCSASCGSGKKSHRLGESVLQAEPWCAVWHDTDSLTEPWSH